jgi:hypothetical protein
VADDKVQNRINIYLKGEISKADFLEELKYHEETHQNYSSKTFMQLADESTDLYQKSWQEIYKRLKKELQL